ncbi:MAG: hypothetical protein ACE5D7_09250 [Fidelibacterota bacterium]
MIPFSLFIAQEENIQFDPEEIHEISSQMEDLEAYEILNLSGHYRFRLNPNDPSNRWHHRSWMSQKNWKFGYRLDKTSSMGSWDVSRYAINTKVNSVQINMGHLQQEIGQGLLFGSSYGRTKSSSQPFSLLNNRNKFNFQLGSVIEKPLTGILVVVPDNNLIHACLLSDHNGEKIVSYSARKGNEFIYVGGVIAGKRVHNRTVSHAASIYLSLNDEFSTVTGEYAFNGKSGSLAFNIFQKKSNLQWGVHYHSYPDEWSSMYGEPYSVMHSGKNESGLMGMVRFNYRKKLLTGWLELVKEQKNKNGYPVAFGSDWMIRFDTVVNKLGMLIFQIREKQRREIQEYVLNGLQKEVQSPVTRTQIMVTWILSSKYKVQFQKLRVKSDIRLNEDGQLISIYTPDIKLKGVKLKTGLILFSSDSWDSRLYSWIPGLKGEFQFPALYGTGVEIFSKWSYEISPQTNVSFRHSYTWKNSINLQSKEILFQFESTF